MSCGACADACPSGAIEDRSLVALGRPDRFTRTTCPYCGVGCELEVGTRDGRIVQVRPALDAPVNKGHLCVKGRYAFGFVDAPDRVTTPMLRDGDALARGLVGRGARATSPSGSPRSAPRTGPDAIGVLGSARATNEDNYVAQKFARVVLGTNNVDCCARVCHAPSAAALSAMLGTGAATSSFDDIERASTILVCGANATENHPDRRRAHPPGGAARRAPDRDRPAADRARGDRRPPPPAAPRHEHPAPATRSRT